MKIKKKEYRNDLKDAFWIGVEAGINITLLNPEIAKQHRDNPDVIRGLLENSFDESVLGSDDE